MHGGHLGDPDDQQFAARPGGDARLARFEGLVPIDPDRTAPFVADVAVGEDVRHAGHGLRVDDAAAAIGRHRHAAEIDDVGGGTGKRDRSETRAWTGAGLESAAAASATAIQVRLRRFSPRPFGLGAGAGGASA